LVHENPAAPGSIDWEEISMVGRAHKLTVILAVASLAAFGTIYSSLQAADVLVNGGLEQGAGPDKWTLTQVIAPSGVPGDFNGNGTVDAPDYAYWRKTDNTPSNYTLFRSNFGSTTAGGGGQPVSAAEQIDDGQEGFDNTPPATGLGLIVRPFAGNVGPFLDQNKPVNLTLSQTFPQGISAGGHTFYFSGHSSFQSAYSGNIDTLFSDAPSPNAPSPTQTKFMMEFLDAGNALLGSASVDLPRNRTDSDPRTWVTTTVSALAPTNTTQIRVSAVATNMVASCTTACPAGQDVRFDNFSLTQDSPTGFNKLGTRNGNLDTPGAPTNWTLVAPNAAAAQFSHDTTFATHTGQTGFWLRSFSGTQAAPLDAKIVQTVAATPGTSYTFSSWAKLQEGYSGLMPNSGTPSGTNTFITMEFLKTDGTTIGSPVSLELGPNGPLGPNFWPADGPPNGTPPDDPHQGDWRQVSLPATIAPALTASIRVSAGATGMFASGANFAQSALFDDLSLIVPGSGSGNLLGGNLAASTIPEPATCYLVFAAISCVLGIRRRRCM